MTNEQMGKSVVELLERVRQHLVVLEKEVGCYNLDTDIEDIREVQRRLTSDIKK